jgi:hypothetical protein
VLSRKIYITDTEFGMILENWPVVTHENSRTPYLMNCNGFESCYPSSSVLTVSGLNRVEAPTRNSVGIQYYNMHVSGVL